MLNLYAKNYVTFYVKTNSKLKGNLLGFQKGFNPFSTSVPLPYSLKTETRRFSDVSRVYRSGALVGNGLKELNNNNGTKIYPFDKGKRF